MLGAQYDAGLAWVHFPEGFGGLGVSPKLQNIVNAKLTAAGAPLPYGRNPIGHGMCAPTVVTHGSDEQKRRYLRPLFTSEEIWCQMFSEPGAGSDVAGLSTRAVRDGDEWILNGQKVWTTLAHVARFGIVIVRTDTEKPKHKGLTMFVVDMQAPGVEVRPLVQATGEAEFNEVYFTDVRVHDSERLGDIGEGWDVSLDHAHERAGVDRRSGAPARVGTDRARAARVRAAPRRRERQPTRDEFARLWIDAEVNRLTNIRASQIAQEGNARTGGVRRQAGDGVAQPADDGLHDEPDGRRGDALPGRLPDVAAHDGDGPVEPAEGVHPGAGQLDRGRDHPDHEEHPRRAGPRSARATSGSTRTGPGARSRAARAPVRLRRT